MIDTRPHAVGEYLRQLERSLKDLPADRRSEIVGEIEDHIENLLTDLGPQPGEADVRNVLERVGAPEVIAAEARDDAEPARARANWTDIGAVLLLPIPFLGWIVGAVLLWLSDVWSTRDKLIGTLAGPGMFVLGLLVTIASSSGAASDSGEVGGAGLGPIEVLVLALLLLAPLAAAIYLALKLRREPA
jgi:uncharacterized membrane protein